MFFRFRNILPKHQIKKRFFSNQCKFNSNELDTVKNELYNINHKLLYIYYINSANCFISFLILLIK